MQPSFLIGESFQPTLNPVRKHSASLPEAHMCQVMESLPTA